MGVFMTVKKKKCLSLNNLMNWPANLGLKLRQQAERLRCWTGKQISNC